MCIMSVCADFLTINCAQELPENELATRVFSTTRDPASVEERVLETDSKEAVRELVHILPSLTHVCLQEPTGNELAIVSAMEECTSVEPESRDMERNSKATVRGSIHILPLSLTHI